jgi:hypothetical protein
MADNSLIKFQARAHQICDFGGLVFGSITPTDIDGFIEYQNKADIFIELKYEDAQLPFGQRLAYERLVDDIRKTGKPAICIIATHKTSDPLIDIDISRALVNEYRWKGQWHTIKNRKTVREFIDLFFSKIGVIQ